MKKLFDTIALSIFVTLNAILLLFSFTAPAYADTQTIKIVYDTRGGTWQAPGEDIYDSSDNVVYDNGSYVVTIPTGATYMDMGVGRVDTTATCVVNVRGAIRDGQRVHVSISGDTDDEGLTTTVTQDKTDWTPLDTYGHLNPDGSISGTDSTFTIHTFGEAKSVGNQVTTIGYSSTLVGE